MAKKTFTIASVLLVLLSGIVSATDTTTGHPILGLESGESRLVGGVLYSYNVAPESRPVFVPGLPEKFQTGLAPSLKILSSKKATAKERHRAQTAISDTLLKYWTEPLPEAKQGDVKKAYKQAQKAAAQVRVDLAKKSITEDIAVKQLAEIAADLKLSEARAFAGVAAAQKRRYRSWRGKAAPDKGKVRADLVAAYKAFFSGVYLKKKKEEKAQKKTMKILPRRFGENHPEIVAVGQPTVVQPPSFWHWYFCSRLPSVKFAGCSVQTYPQPEVTKWGYAVFLSEHPAIDDEIPEFLGPYHTSVLAGLYKLTTKTTFMYVTHTTYKIPPEYDVRLYKHEVSSETFQEWLMGNGSGSWIEENDTFHPFQQADGTTKPFAKVEYFDTEAEARANAATPWGPDPIDACSYSVGDYGLGWICHQNSNCFAWKMWNIQWLVNYFSNSVLGPGGTGGAGVGDDYEFFNYGCAQRVDPVQGESHDKGGVPGYFYWDLTSFPWVPDGLFYQITKPYVQNEAAAIVEQLMATGEGLGLDSQRCKFNEAEVPENIVGPNYSWSTLREIPWP